MSTVARTNPERWSHWYSKDGKPQYEIMGKTTGRPRPVTIRDARENDWVPGVTTILKCLSAPALTTWLCEQAALAVLTTPRKDGEELDAFVQRVLHEERHQEQEAQAARDLGTRIHNEIEIGLKGQSISSEMAPFVEPAIEEILKAGRMVETEKIVVGDCYAGRMDALTEGDVIRVWDIKTTKNLPKYGSYPEARLQLSAYAAALGNKAVRIETANVYVSTKSPGQLLVDVHQDWRETYDHGFKPLVAVWQWMNDYAPPSKP